jgi:S-adenosyl-L-methionine hydrolase (adenosine-forming)
LQNIEQAAVIKHITLTTDYGLHDAYVAAVKGQLLRQHPAALLIDISHNISKYNLQEAAYLLKNAYHFFPDGSLHLVDVSNYNLPAVDFMLFAHEGHHFVMPNNGLASLLTENAYLDFYLVPANGRAALHPFALLNDLLPAIQPFLQGQSAEELYGPPANDYHMLMPLLPATSGNNLNGVVLHIDGYENIITNIDRPYFNRFVKPNEAFTIHLKRKVNHENRVTRLVDSYEDVAPGDIACFFGHNNLLQISVRGGNAASLLGMRVNDPIFIEKS